MNNFYFIIIIWGVTYFLIGGEERRGRDYNYLAPDWLKIIGNPLAVTKEVSLSTALVRVWNNLLFVLSVVGYFFENDRDIYWKVSGAKYIAIVIILYNFSIIAEQIFVIHGKSKKRDSNIGGNIFVICFFFMFSLAMMYIYYKFIILPVL